MTVEGMRESDIPRITIGAGALIAIGGVFVTLAAYQILPHCINIISQLGSLGQGIGYSVITVGTLIFVGGVIAHLCLLKKLHGENEPPSFHKEQTLEGLFEEDPQFLQTLPKYPNQTNDLPNFDPNLIHHPVVQGSFGEFPFIAITIRCLSTTDEILNSTSIPDRDKLGLGKSYTEDELRNCIEEEKSHPMVILLLRDSNHRWAINDYYAYQGHNPLLATSFIRGCRGQYGRHPSLHAFVENQTLMEAEEKGLAALKQLMRGEGEVLDLNGIRWTLSTSD